MNEVPERNLDLKYVQTESSGYVLVQGGDATTYIYTTWSDWQETYQGDFESYTESVLDLTAIMTARFPHGLMRVGDVRDEINLNTGGITVGVNVTSDVKEPEKIEWLNPNILLERETYVLARQFTTIAASP